MDSALNWSSDAFFKPTNGDEQKNCQDAVSSMSCRTITLHSNTLNKYQIAEQNCAQFRIVLFIAPNYLELYWPYLCICELLSKSFSIPTEWIDSNFNFFTSNTPIFRALISSIKLTKKMYIFLKIVINELTVSKAAETF